MTWRILLSAIATTAILSGCTNTPQQSAGSTSATETVAALKMPAVGSSQGRGAAPATPAPRPVAIPGWQKLASVFQTGSSHSAPHWDNGGTAARSLHPDDPHGVLTLAPPPPPPPVHVTPTRAAPSPRGGSSPSGGGTGINRGGSAPLPQPGTGGATGTGNGTQPTTPPDPSSDRIPPILAGISFSPAQITDGQSSTLTVNATDDLSGVHSVSGTVVSPSGKAVLGFACQPTGGDLYQTTITIPKDAEQGLWYVGTVYLTDKANNASNVNFNAATASAGGRLQVTSSNSDSTPPVLQSINVENPTVADGAKDSIIVTATDDSSGVASVSGVFLSPTKAARIGFSCSASDDSGTTWVGGIVLPQNADCGQWTLQQIQLIDKANNRALFGTDNPIVAKVSFLLTGSGSCDSTPPVLQSFFVSPSSVSNAEDSELTISAVVTDDGTGVAAVTGRFDGPPPTTPGSQVPRIYFSLQGNPQDPTQPWTGHVTVPKFSAKGTWVVGSVQVVDKANNSKSYSSSDAVLSSGRFNVN